MQFLKSVEAPGVSFRYDGRASDEFLGQWEAAARTESVPSGTMEHRTCLDDVTGLAVTVHVRRFDDFAAVEWVAEFENTGTADTPIIEDILPLDISIPVDKGEMVRLHHANGSSCRMDDFLPMSTNLPPRASKTLTPVGGRSSNGVMSFMNLQRKDCGLVLAVGWSGQWSASFGRDNEGALRLTAGMERTHLRLHTGEKVRTPRMLVLGWDGDDPEAGNNLLRQLMLAHYLPRIDGTLVVPPVAQCLQAYFYLTDKAGEAFEMKALPKASAAGVDTYWIDACWYGGQGSWSSQAGSWVVNRDKFPNGLKPISDAAHEKGMPFVLWFEPERARVGSLLHQEHPEFLLACESDTSNLLLNLGLPEAREHITALISEAITEHGVDVYRQDFNFDPLPYWQAADTPERIGMTEIRHVEGLYLFWDELRRRHPKLWIDNCASGGRRIDLETMSRSLPLWPSDFPDIVGLPFGQGLHVGDQCINAGLARWIPLFGGSVWNFTPYSTRGPIIGGFSFGFHIEQDKFPSDDTASVVTPHDVMALGETLLDDDFPVDLLSAAIGEWESVRPFFTGDFHLLLPLTAAYHDWCAWQLHREDMGAGVAAFFRRHASPFSTMEIGLKRVDPAAEYEVSISPGYEEAPKTRMAGQQLARLTITIPEARNSLLLRYTRVE